MKRKMVVAFALGALAAGGCDPLCRPAHHTALIMQGQADVRACGAQRASDSIEAIDRWVDCVNSSIAARRPFAAGPYNEGNQDGDGGATFILGRVVGDNYEMMQVDGGSLGSTQPRVWITRASTMGPVSRSTARGLPLVVVPRSVESSTAATVYDPPRSVPSGSACGPTN